MVVNSINLHLYINQNIINSFNSFIIKKEDPNACWGWVGCIGGNGYPRISIKNQSIEAHRISYVMHKGIIPQKGLVIRHLCNNPICTNPNHLKIGTKQDNEIDRAKSGGDFKKLTKEQVKEIRHRCALCETFASIAKDFNITPSTVNKIKHFQRHKERNANQSLNST